MNTYLCIITTVLVLTQIIRLIQNSINLHRQNMAIKRDVAWLKDRDIKQVDFDTQRECFYLLRDWLRRQEMRQDEDNQTTGL
jgi:hypothetical protein